MGRSKKAARKSRIHLDSVFMSNRIIGQKYESFLKIENLLSKLVFLLFETTAAVSTRRIGAEQAACGFFMEVHSFVHSVSVRMFSGDKNNGFLHLR